MKREYGYYKKKDSKLIIEIRGIINKIWDTTFKDELDIKTGWYNVRETDLPLKGDVNYLILQSRLLILIPKGVGEATGVLLAVWLPEKDGTPINFEEDAIFLMNIMYPDGDMRTFITNIMKSYLRYKVDAVMGIDNDCIVCKGFHKKFGMPYKDYRAIITKESVMNIVTAINDTLSGFLALPDDMEEGEDYDFGIMDDTGEDNK